MGGAGLASPCREVTSDSGEQEQVHSSAQPGLPLRGACQPPQQELIHSFIPQIFTERLL